MVRSVLESLGPDPTKCDVEPIIARGTWVKISPDIPNSNSGSSTSMPLPVTTTTGSATQVISDGSSSVVAPQKKKLNGFIDPVSHETIYTSSYCEEDRVADYHRNDYYGIDRLKGLDEDRFRFLSHLGVGGLDKSLEESQKNSQLARVVSVRGDIARIEYVVTKKQWRVKYADKLLNKWIRSAVSSVEGGSNSRFAAGSMNCCSVFMCCFHAPLITLRNNLFSHSRRRAKIIVPCISLRYCHNAYRTVLVFVQYSAIQ